MRKRLLSMFLAVAMLMSLLPTISIAAGTEIPTAFSVDLAAYTSTFSDKRIVSGKTNRWYIFEGDEVKGENWSLITDASVSNILSGTTKTAVQHFNTYLPLSVTEEYAEAGYDTLAIEVTAPIAGIYAVSVVGRSSGSGVEFSASVNNADIGTWSLLSSTTGVSAGGKVTCSSAVPVVLNKGTNVVKIRNGQGQNGYFGFEFAPVGNLDTISLTYDKPYILLTDTEEKLSLSMEYSSGISVNPDDAAVVYSYSKDGVVTVADDGTITPLSEGNVTVTASVTVGNVTKTASVDLVIREEIGDDPFEFAIDFSAPTSDLTKLTVSDKDKGRYYILADDEVYGYNWRILTNTDVSTILKVEKKVQHFGEGKYITMILNSDAVASGNDTFSFIVTVPVTGIYDVCADVWGSGEGGYAEALIDGRTVGTESLRNTDIGLGKTSITFDKSIYLTAGEHTVKIKNSLYTDATKASNGFYGFKFMPSGMLGEISLSYDKSYILLSDTDGEKLSLSVKYESGTEVDVNAENVNVIFKSSDETVATVSNDGVVTPLRAGDVRIGVVVQLLNAEGEVIDQKITKDLTLRISEEVVYNTVDIDFTAVNEDTLELNGSYVVRNGTAEGPNWKLNTNKNKSTIFSSNNRVRFFGSYLQIGVSSSDLNIGRDRVVVTFDVDYDGIYDIDLFGATSPSGGIGSFYIDNKYIGEYDFYAAVADSEGAKECFRSLELAEGNHTLTIVASRSSAGSAYLLPARIRLTETETLSPVALIGVETARSSIAVGESEPYRIYVQQENGVKYYAMPPLKEKDSINLTLASNNPDAITVEEGDFLRAKAVTADPVGLTVSGTVEGQDVSGKGKEYYFSVNDAVYKEDGPKLDVVYDVFYTGGETVISASAYLTNGAKIADRDITCYFESDDETLAAFDGKKQSEPKTGDPTATLQTVKEGDPTITAYVTFNGITHTASEQIHIETTVLEKIDAETEGAVISLLDTDGSPLVVTGTNNSGTEADISGATFEYEVPEEYAHLISVDDEGRVYAEGRGSAKIKVTATIGGKVFECISTVVASSEKKEPTLYTYEMRENALDNIGKYDWAKSAQKKAIADADKWLPHLEKLYDSVMYEGIPRTYCLGLHEGPEDFDYTCAYCNEDIRLKHSSYGWKIDPINRPFKIQCPNCKRLFPSNEFDDFYKLGLDQKGQFNRLRALDAHRAMLLEQGKALPGSAPSEERRAEIDSGLVLNEEERAYFGYGVEGGYLYNSLYRDAAKNSVIIINATYDENGNVKEPEVRVTEDTLNTFAVDDGFGWFTGEWKTTSKSSGTVEEKEPEDEFMSEYESSFEENLEDDESEDESDDSVITSGEYSFPVVKTFIPFYHHSMYSINGENYLRLAIGAFTDAYLYTGDIKYGRAGAILTDRFADVYPSFDLNQYPEYQNSHGGKNNGKILGSIWEHGTSNAFASSYDACYDVFDDPQVIEFLSEKAAQFGLENPKTSGDLIRENCDNGILREIMKAVRSYRIGGNYGMHQGAAVRAAIALDTYPETGEMIEWLTKPGTQKKDSIVRYGKSYNRYIEHGGGEMLTQYVNDVDRDGFGWEVASGYNQSWLTSSYSIAEHLYRYKRNEGFSPYDDPKYRKMFNSIYQMTMAGDYTLQLGDDERTASTKNKTSVTATLIAFKRFGDPLYAQILYNLKKGDLDSVYIDIFEKNAGDIAKEVEKVIEEYGEYKLGSRNLTGFGLTVLSGGELIKNGGSIPDSDFRRDTWISYTNSAKSHAHYDKLQLGIDAYGFNFTPDLGYPKETGSDPNRAQWVKATISHNTVVVDGKSQKGVEFAYPYHYDGDGIVKLFDADASNAYDETDIYRRTVVSVDASDEVAYTVDFFRVKGGNEHVYSFHTQSADGVTTDDFELVPQVDANGNYIGSYAGENVRPEGDPGGSSPNNIYPIGYAWLRNVRRAAPSSGSFSVNFEQTDFKKQVKDPKGLNLKFTALNDWTPSSIGIAAGDPPRRTENTVIPHLDYMLIHNKGENLDTLFTSVIQPYKGEEYIESMAALPLTCNGTEGELDESRAVKVVLKSGRTDYIIYATNNELTYTLTDGDVSFDFNGFVGVYSVNKAGKNIYSYVNDGTKIGDVQTEARYTGQVESFTDIVSSENEIVVTLDRELTDTEITALAGEYVYIESDGVDNAVYKIESASGSGKEITLDIGDVTTVRKFKSASKLAAGGYVYNIAPERKLYIPLSAEDYNGPDVEKISDATVSAGSTLTLQINAEAADNESVTYIGTVLPRDASINQETGKITWKPDGSQVGENGFLITVRDESGRESSVSFEVTVYGSTMGSKNETTETPSDNAGTTGGGGGGGAAPDTGDASDQTEVPNDDDKTDNTENSPDASGETDNIRFTDLSNHAWAADAINTLADDGIIRGTTSDTFSPANNITRADFASLLVRAFSLESENTENFADVSASDYFAPELAIARNTGIVNGIGENKYAPRNHITRRDMMVITYRALSTLEASLREVAEQKRSVGAAMNDSPVDCQNRDVTESQRDGGPSNDGGRSPTDVPADNYPDWETVAPYAREAVASLIGAGIVNGKNNLIAPTDYTTRAEVAVLIKRILDYTKK